MNTTYNTQEQGLLMKAAHVTKYSTARIAEVINAIHEANLDDDITAAIAHLDEVETN